MFGNIVSTDAGLIVAGLTLLIWGADRFVHGAAATARNLGVAPLLIGLTIVAFATSAPEILVSVVAASQGQPGLAFGNAIGSNIVNIGLVLGVTAIVRPIPLRSATLRREMPALLAVSLLTVSLFLDTRLSRPDGVVMLTGLDYDVARCKAFHEVGADWYFSKPRSPLALAVKVEGFLNAK